MITKYLVAYKDHPVCIIVFKLNTLISKCQHNEFKFKFIIGKVVRIRNFVSKIYYLIDNY